MRKLRHLIIFLSLVTILLFVGYVVPHFFAVPQISFLSQFQSSPEVTDTIPTDTLPYIDQLKNSIPVIKVIPARKSNREVWMVGKGISLPNYLLRAQKHLERQQGRVLRMEELAKPNAVNFDFRTPDGDTLQIELRTSEIFLDSASQIAVAFMVDTLTLASLDALNKLPFGYALLITPFQAPPSLFYDLDRLKNKELVIWLPMESYSLQENRLAQDAICIHHTEKAIEEKIENAFSRIPNAAGVATRMGQRAVEHRNLLNALFKPISEHQRWFLDLTQNRYSKVPEACKNFSMTCKQITPYTTKVSLEKYISDGLWSATRTGSAVLVLPLTEESLGVVKDLKEKTSVQGTEIVNLSNVIATGE